MICFLKKSTSIGYFFISVINFFCRFDLSVLYCVFETNPLVSIALGWAANLSYTLLSTMLLSLLKSPGTLFSLSVSILSTSVFNLAKSAFAAKLDVLAPVAPFKSAFVANLVYFSLFYENVKWFRKKLTILYKNIFFYQSNY